VIGVRLQGGPFDGERWYDYELDSTPPHVWTLWRDGEVEARRSPIAGALVYRRDAVDARGWLVYVWVDPNLDVHDELLDALEQARQEAMA
jgi:hypothetical protein